MGRSSATINWVEGHLEGFERVFVLGAGTWLIHRGMHLRKMAHLKQSE